MTECPLSAEGNWRDFIGAAEKKWLRNCVVYGYCEEEEEEEEEGEEKEEEKQEEEKEEEEEEEEKENLIKEQWNKWTKEGFEWINEERFCQKNKIFRWLYLANNHLFDEKLKREWLNGRMNDKRTKCHLKLTWRQD